MLAWVSSASLAATADYAAGGLAARGQGLPVSMVIANTFPEDATQVELRSNQLFTYRFHLLVPQGQTRTLAFAPWYFDGPRLAFEGGLISARPERTTLWNMAATTLPVRTLGPDTALLLYDPDDVRAEEAENGRPLWTAYYFPPDATGLPADLSGVALAKPEAPVQAGRPAGTVHCEPVRAGQLTAALLKDSPAAGLVVSPGNANLSALRQVAAAAGIDLWLLGDESPAVEVPAALRALAGQTHVRPELFDWGAEATAAGRIPPSLFVMHGWPAEECLDLMWPLLATTAALVSLALVCWNWPRRAKLAAAALVILGGAVWTRVAVERRPLQSVETVTVTYCDAGSGRSFTEHIAAAQALRAGGVQLKFTRGADHAPRPLMAAEIDRVVYEGLILSRDLEGRWAVDGLALRPGLLLAFETTRWDEEALEADGLSLSMQSEGPVVRLDNYRALDDAYLYLDGQAYRLSGLSTQGLYRPAGEGKDIDAAAFAPEGPVDDFRRRAMRWLARNVARGDMALFFGWQEAAPAVEASGARMENHGRLMVHFVPRPASAPL